MVILPNCSIYEVFDFKILFNNLAIQLLSN